MSRGGRGGGRGGKRGPDLSWDDDDSNDVQQNVKNVPGPLFPDRYLRTPKPLSQNEVSSIDDLLRIRSRIRHGPTYTVLESSALLDSKGKANPRAGFDPFNDQERFTKKYHPKRRTIPDLSERGGHTLTLFPVELWPVLDPKHKQKDYWNKVPDEVKARLTSNGTTPRSTKRKHNGRLTYDDNDDLTGAAAAPHTNASDAEENDEDEDVEDDDGILDGTRRRKRTAAKSRRDDPTIKERQKKGLDAEDDYPDVEQQQQQQQQQDDDGADGAAAAEEPQDSEFGTDEEEDDGADDYNAEQYFDDGEGDDFGGDDGDDDGGGGGGEYY